MKSANWMAFYIGDYVKNTLKLTTQQHGAYLLLILACWQGEGSVEGDDETLACITKLSMADWLGARPKLASYFEITPEKWTHRRVLEELADTARVRRERSAAGQRGAARRWEGHDGAMADALSHWRTDRKTMHPHLHHHLHHHNPLHPHPLRKCARAQRD
jgi:uncharacterized protein YdaU (DUF1376 family)